MDESTHNRQAGEFLTNGGILETSLGKVQIIAKIIETFRYQNGFLF